MARPIFDDQGRLVQLGRELGRGGEGYVAEIHGLTDRVAKIYHRPLSPLRSAKLSHMVRSASEQLLGIAAWPVHTLHEKGTGEMIGFVMPRVTEFSEVHVLHGPKSRLQHFPSAGWPFLVHTATNAARAFTVIHQRGHVVGDVNDRNLLVSQAATVKFIDCDSFQIKGQSTVYPCEVGVPTHTAPELQGQSLRNVVRTVNHDSFGLAILLFQLLFMGRHPFAGRSSLPGEMPIERAIREHRFAYGPKSVNRGMQPPPASVPLSIVPASMADLFERAFSAEGAILGRPTPEAWLAELQRLSQELKQCNLELSHRYYRSLPTCPWCALEGASGITLFAAVVRTVHASSTAFDTSTFVARLEKFIPPSSLPLIPSLASVGATPSPNVLKLNAGRKAKRRKGLVIVAIGAAVALPMWQISIIAALIVVVIAWLVAFRVSRFNPPELELASQKARQELRQAQVKWEILEERWKTTSPEWFEQRRSELRRMLREYEALPGLRDAKLRGLKASAQDRHFHEYLNAHRISMARIPGIGPSRIAMLRSYGVETADDISSRVLQIPGFGPGFTGNLQRWRKDVERRYKQPSDDVLLRLDKAKVDQELSQKKAQMIQDLQQGITTLEHVRAQAVSKRDAIQPLLQPTLQALKQAEVDLQSLENH